MKVVPFQVVSDLQPNLTLSVVLECPSIGTSEKLLFVGFLKSRFSEPLGTDID